MSRKGDRRRHHKVEQLPDEIRRQVDKMLADGHTYEEVVEAVRKAGESIGKSSVGRYYSQYAAAAERIQKAREGMMAVVEAVQDRPDTDLGQAANAIMMQALLDRVALASSGDIQDMELDKAGRLIATLQRADIARERLKLAYQAKAQKAVAEIESKATEKGIDPETLRFIKEQVYGIV